MLAAFCLSPADNEMSCEWAIDFSPHDIRIRLHFTEFELELDWDSLIVYDGASTHERSSK